MSEKIDAFDGSGKFVGKLDAGGLTNSNYTGPIFDASGQSLGKIDSVTRAHVPQSGGSGNIGNTLGAEAGLAVIVALILLSLVAAPVVLWGVGLRTYRKKDKLAGIAFIFAGFVMLGVLTAWSVFDLFGEEFPQAEPTTIVFLEHQYEMWVFSSLMGVHYMLFLISTVGTYASYRRLALPDQPIRQIMSVKEIQNYRIALMCILLIGVYAFIILTVYLGEILLIWYYTTHGLCIDPATDATTKLLTSYFCK